SALVTALCRNSLSGKGLRAPLGCPASRSRTNTGQTTSQTDPFWPPRGGVSSAGQTDTQRRRLPPVGPAEASKLRTQGSRVSTTRGSALWTLAEYARPLSWSLRKMYIFIWAQSKRLGHAGASHW